jgi:hypothetical protein
MAILLAWKDTIGKTWATQKQLIFHPTIAITVSLKFKLGEGDRLVKNRSCRVFAHNLPFVSQSNLQIKINDFVIACSKKLVRIKLAKKKRET